jgi:hypothetical protein
VNERVLTNSHVVCVIIITLSAIISVNKYVKVSEMECVCVCVAMCCEICLPARRGILKVI